MEPGAGDPPATRQMWIERKLESYGVVRVQIGIAIAVVLIALAAQRGWFGSDRIFAAQLLVTMLSLAMSPLLLFYPVPRHPVLLCIFALFACLALLPCTAALLQNLLFGHLRPDAQWYDAFWRIYAILALWICFAVVNEAKLRPLWRTYCLNRRKNQQSNSFSHESVLSRADAMRRAQRDAKLNQLRDRVDTTIKQKKAAEAAIAAFDRTAETARKNLMETRRMVDEARERVALCENTTSDEQEAAQKALDKALLLADGAADHERGLEAQKSAYEIMQLQATEQLKQLREAWKEASDLGNYGFYR